MNFLKVGPKDGIAAKALWPLWGDSKFPGLPEFDILHLQTKTKKFHDLTEMSSEAQIARVNVKQTAKASKPNFLEFPEQVIVDMMNSSTNNYLKGEKHES